MPEALESTFMHREFVAKITAAYLRRNKLPSDELSSLLSIVHRTLVRLGKPTEAVTARAPAIPIRRSVRPGYVVCIECRWRGKMLRRHLGVAHGLKPEEYRARWGLPPEHPLTAPEYSKQRSDFAKLFGLGRSRNAPASDARGGAQEPVDDGPVA
jgi:predicted transcriptional regulator